MPLTFSLIHYIMEIAYVCEWEKRPKSNHCPSIPLVCAWSCRNLIAFTTDLKNEEDDKGLDNDFIINITRPVGELLMNDEEKHTLLFGSELEIPRTSVFFSFF